MSHLSGNATDVAGLEAQVAGFQLHDERGVKSVGFVDLDVGHNPLPIVVVMSYHNVVAGVHGDGDFQVILDEHLHRFLHNRGWSLGQRVTLFMAQPMKLMHDWQDGLGLYQSVSQRP